MKKRVYIFPTFACTLNCPRCYQKQLGVPRDYRLSARQFQRIIERLEEQDYDETDWVFTGGEPTLWPDLRWAVERVKRDRPGCKVRIVSNGYGRTLSDYGYADVIQISDYGAINRMDQYRLKKQGGSRVKIQASVHWDWDRSIHSELPGICGCDGPSFVADHVWPCAMTAAAQWETPLSVEQEFVSLMAGPPAHLHEPRLFPRPAHYQDFCTSCLVNRKNRQAPRPVIQVSLWEGRSVIVG